MQKYELRLINEYNDLADRTRNLRSFIGSEKFQELSAEDKSLLVLQLSQMTPLLETLKERVFRINISNTDSEELTEVFKEAELVVSNSDVIEPVKELSDEFELSDEPVIQNVVSDAVLETVSETTVVEEKVIEPAPVIPTAPKRGRPAKAQ